VPKQASAPAVKELRNFLQQQLPDYMVPSAFVMLDVLPFTPNGKVDRRALPAPNLMRQVVEKTFVAPQTTGEIKLAQIWSEILGIQPIGVEDNFFELGGHSLVAIQVISQVRAILGISLSLHQLFEAPTIAALSKLIEQHNPAQENLEVQKIQPVPHNIPLPLSFTQESLWFLWQLESNVSNYNISTAHRLQGKLNVELLSQSWTALVSSQEALRTSFINVDGQGMQVINPCVAIEIPVVDLQHLPEHQRQLEAEKLIQETIAQPFDLTVYPLWRVKLVRVAPEEYFLLISIHHIIFDDWSLNLLFANLAILYQALLTNQPVSLPDLPIQYADFALWQRQYLKGENLELKLNYWKKQLAGIPPLVELPTDRPRPPVSSYVGKSQYIELPQSLTEDLKRLSQREGVTLFMMLLAAFKTLLYRYCGQSDIVVGSPIAGRNLEETHKIIGYFVNTLVLRTDLSEKPTFTQLLKQVKVMALDAYEHQELPFEKLVEYLNPERSSSYHPLFQVMFTLQTARVQSFELAGVNLAKIRLNTKACKFDLTLDLAETPTGIKGYLGYCTDLFDDSTIARMAGHLQTLLAGIVANPDEKITQLPLLTAKEKQQLLVEWNNTVADYPQDKCIHQLIEKQVKANPDAIAVVFEGQYLSYGQLNSKANQLAHYLRTLGVGTNTLVAICLERSLEMAVGFLGIFKAGGAYVPLDPSYPSDRLAYMLADSQALVILTQQRLVNILPEHQAKVICLDTNWSQVAKHSQENPVVDINSEALAYVMYTSGSTGKPKGVMITHRGLVNHNTAIAKLFELKPRDRMLQSASISFDIAVEEIFPTWISGASLILRPEEVLASTRSFLQFVEREQITILDLPTALWHEIVNGMRELGDKLPNCVRLLVVGGEKASKVAYLHWWDLVGKQCRWINTYGPTETTVSATFYEPVVQQENQQSIGEIPIGRPLDNTQIYILDEQLQPVPISVPGEIYIGGAGVARGYLNRADLIAAQFITNPFAALFPKYQDRCLYRTNDKARYLPDGNIEFLGRNNYQVKMRGFRIELAEIEALLNQYPHVEENVVIAREDESANQRLVAYIVAPQKQAPKINELRQFLEKQLPNYMIPSAFVVLEALPLTPNGKIDRRALPAPEYHRQDMERTLVEPQDRLEIQIAEIWQKLLGIKHLGITDNFFELGGHSLLAVRLFNEIEKICGVSLPLGTLFKSPTIEALASFIREEKWSAPIEVLVKIQSGSSRKLPLFCVHAVWGNVLFYQQLTKYIPPDQPLYALQAQGLDGKKPPLNRVEDMASHYLNEIRNIQPHGPYLLAGYSFGGLVAFEMAQQLHAQGQKVAMLILLDTISPNLSKVRPSSAQSLWIHLSRIGQLKPKEAFQYIWGRINYRLIKNNPTQFIKNSIIENSNQTQLLTPAIIEVAQNNHQASENYQAKVYPGKLILFRPKLPSMDRVLCPDHLGWEDVVTEGVEIHTISGDHGMFIEPHIQVLAKEIRSCLEQVDAETLVKRGSIDE
ncbi:MAG: amino acid adenylation domain-containing protein, partial [Crinalium sp.]